jgi:hypothetical protein
MCAGTSRNNTAIAMDSYALPRGELRVPAFSRSYEIS